jgi:hypothetical protein
LLVQLFRDYGQTFSKGRSLSDSDIIDAVKRKAFGANNSHRRENGVDDFAAVGADTVEELRDRFIPNFFFGSETDDPTVAHAFNTKVNALGERVNAFWSSDVGHWDVPEQSDVLANTLALAEKGVLTERDVRDLVFANPYKFYTDANPDFFKGTSIERAIGTAAQAAE